MTNALQSKTWPYVGAIAVMAIMILTAGPLLAFATVAGLLVLYFACVSPKVSLVLWIATVCALPFWFGLRLFVYWPPTTLVGLLVLGGILVRRRFRLEGMTVWDWLAFGFFALTVVLAIGAQSTTGNMFTAIGQWMVAFLVGRMLVLETGVEFALRTIGVLFSVVAAFTIVEHFTATNLFESTVPSGPQFATIAGIQERGGVIRAEFSFGHAIALSNCLAMAIPAVVASRLPAIARLLMTVLLAVATLFTYSRSGILSMVIALVLCVYVLKGDEMKAWVKGLFAAAFVVAYIYIAPLILDVFADSTAETSRNSEYRLRLFEMVGYLRPFGLADEYVEFDGRFVWHGISSIDNAFLRLGVNFGWFAALLVLAIFGVACARVLLRNATAPIIALAAITPALFTVALITQFGAFVWFYIGMAAIAAHQRRRDEPRVELRREAVAA